MTTQLPLFPQLNHKFPSTRYQGSKAKLVNWIWEQINELDFRSCLDAFGGTGVIAYKFKTEGKCVTYNDKLTFNYHFGRALIENRDVILSDDDIEWILTSHDHRYPTFVADNFHDIYFTDSENQWIDRTITNIWQLDNKYKQSLAFFALAQACIVKRPYNLFHRKNLYIRLADVERSFGNKSSWDKPFSEWFRLFVDEANQAIFDNTEVNVALNKDAIAIENPYDLVYIDTPYISGKGVATDYRDFYHFLEGLTHYDEWEAQIDLKSKHRRLKREPNRWSHKKTIHQVFDALFAHFADSILVISYRSDGIPTINELIHLVGQYKSDVRLLHYGNYQYALSTNKKSQEVLIIAQ